MDAAVRGDHERSCRLRQGLRRVTDRLLTARELGEWLGLSTETVLRRHRRGELPGFRLASNVLESAAGSVDVLRFRESEVEAWLEGRREHVTPGAR